MSSVAPLLYPAPTPTGWDQWFFANRDHHEAVETAMAQQLGTTPVIYKLYPVFQKDMQNWLLEHAAAHDRMRQLLGITGQDLTSLDFSKKTATDAWLWSHYLDHLAASQRLSSTIL